MTTGTTTAFQQALATARARKGLTLAQLAAQLNARTGGKARFQLISNWETGHRYAPNPKTIIALAELLDVDPVDLLTAAGKTHPDVVAALRNPEYHRRAYELAQEYKAEVLGDEGPPPPPSNSNGRP